MDDGFVVLALVHSVSIRPHVLSILPLISLTLGLTMLFLIFLSLGAFLLVVLLLIAIILPLVLLRHLFAFTLLLFFDLGLLSLFPFCSRGYPLIGLESWVGAIAGLEFVALRVNLMPTSGFGAGCFRV